MQKLSSNRFIHMCKLCCDSCALRYVDCDVDMQLFGSGLALVRPLVVHLGSPSLTAFRGSVHVMHILDCGYCDIGVARGIS